MRIIAGKHKGRRIELVKDLSDAIRPTSDFARESIFNILIHGKHGLTDHSFVDYDVLDVFSGTGALGLEALSRGAKSATFIDKARDAIAIARHNAERMNETAVDFLHIDATKLGQAKKTYGVIFIDPPYFSKMLAPTLAGLHAGGWIDKDGIIVIEHDSKETIEIPPPFVMVDERRYGRAKVKLLKLS